MEFVKTNLESRINHLSEEEQKEPVKVIYELFDYSSLYHLRIYLWRYLKATASPIGWHQMRQPLDAVVLQQRLEKLMEGCWLLLQEKEARDGEVNIPYFSPGTAEWMEDDRHMHLEYDDIELEYGASIQRLRQRELNYPVLVLKNFFNTLPLEGWKSLFNEWTEYALSSTSLFQDTENYDLLLHYEQLERLLEVAYYFKLLLVAGEDILSDVSEQDEESTETETSAT
ncbi:hypothetical protein POKO110462_17125 [Pontibacter korlensis]|uniref:Uncharacterized protein n=1 Tax=Pontibacter korlensis TaxID=400092 RepID=A0A0E3UV15_9BACT|nr:hypothetical protein [Pontibacter korlensis]AKD02107.1 hypothetical protein PKOR_01825 [Pontibacter korlensis]